MLGRRGISKQPSPYASVVWLFHGLRVAQVLSSVVVTCFLGFFIRHLEAENYYVPWTFILLISVSAFTLASFIVTSFLHRQRTLKPIYNVYCNSFLGLIWCVGFSLLSWNLSITLMHRCSIENWSTEAGVMVCRIYKALEAFAASGMLSTLLSLILDIRTHRQTIHRGNYNPMGDSKPVPFITHRSPSYHDAPSSFPAPSSSTTNFQDSYSTRDVPLEIPAYSHEGKMSYKAQKPIETNSFGYAAPVEQTRYDGAGDLGLSWGRNGDA
ncbi:hypothetical protein MMC30_002512 [Trapelia coarctata]|nr:hypothetical protein [Trapelia coarctata]